MTEPTYPPGWAPANHYKLRRLADEMRGEGFTYSADKVLEAITPPPPKPERYGPFPAANKPRLTEAETRSLAEQTLPTYEAVGHWRITVCRLYRWDFHLVLHQSRRCFWQDCASHIYQGRVRWWNHRHIGH